MLRTIANLQARDPSRNIARAYRIEIGRDLFGQWVAVRSWGRIGARGRSAQVCVAGPRDAMVLARQWLKDRERAKTRIGVGYRKVR